MNAHELFSSLHQAIQHFVPLTEEEFTDVKGFFKSRQLKKNEHLLQIGQVCELYCFVVHGTLRVYYRNPKQEPVNEFITNWLAFDSYFFTELESYTTHQPSRFGIHATEDSQLLIIRQDDMEQLLTLSPSWQSYVRKNWEQAFLKLTNVIVASQSKTVEERYRELASSPMYAKRVRQKAVTTMLGTSPSAISRIRRKK